MLHLLLFFNETLPGATATQDANNSNVDTNNFIHEEKRLYNYLMKDLRYTKSIRPVNAESEPVRGQL